MAQPNHSHAIRTMTDKPLRGLPPDDALKRWADPVLYSAMMEYSEWSKDVSFGKGHPLAETYPLKHREYRRRREAAEASLIAKLLTGEIVGSGIVEGARRREIIEPSLWDVLDLHYESDSAGGGGVVYEYVEFFERSDVPLNIFPPFPEWLIVHPAPPALFVADATYTHVTIRGVEFILSPTRAKVVRLLDEARLRGEEWQLGQKVLGQAGSTESKMINVFKKLKGWRHLIESDRRGRYRLNI
jgi:hypothetical protein